MTKIAIIGAGGRMGCALVRCAESVPDIDIVAALEQEDHPANGRDSGEYAGVDANGIIIESDPAPLEGADVFIDFSFHESAPMTLTRAAHLGRAVVLGTTGLTSEEREAVLAATEKVPLVWAPNMSLGVNLLFAMVRKAAAVLGDDYDVEIVEAHHRRKKDAPSGTALGLAEQVAAGRGADLDRVGCFGRHGAVGERPRGEIGLHAVRMGAVVGEHTVSFAGEQEIVEFTHRAGSRDSFAAGALKAAAWVKKQAPGHYNMLDVLDLHI